MPLRSSTIPFDPARERHPPAEALVRSSSQVLLEQRLVVAPVDLARVEHELLVHQLEQGRERGDRGGDEVAFDPRNRGLARTRPSGELSLRKAVPAPSLAKEVPGA